MPANALDQTTKTDLWTVAAVAVIAMAAVTVMHEAAGHGGACLALGGRIARLTSVYFGCRPPNPWIDAGGPAGSLACALMAGLAMRALPPAALHARLLALLLFAFAGFWFSGQLIYEILLDKGDFAFAVHGFAPRLGMPLPLRLAGAALGVGLYAVTARIVSRHAAVAGGALRTAWLAATVAAMFAATLYAPDRPGAIKEALYEIGVASFALLLIGRRAGAERAAITPSAPWMIAAGLIYGGFLLTLGRGLS